MSSSSSRRNISLYDEEKLTEEVRKYPVIYDKCHKGYMERDVVLNAWKEIAENLPFLENGNDILHKIIFYR